MPTSLKAPAGYATRPATPDDAVAVTELVTACEEHDIGEALLELEDVIASWQRPSFDPTEHSICVVTGDRLVAYGELSQGSRRAEVFVRPEHRGRGLGAALLAWTWEVARASESALVGQTVPQALTDAVRLFQRSGCEQLWTSWVLELPAGAAIGASEPPAGVAIRPYLPGREERSAYDVIEGAFREWPDRADTAYEDWVAVMLDRPGFQPWQLLVAVEDDDVVGACYLSVSAGVGWVDQIAVRRDHRGRGLARAMLLRAFEEGRAHGATRAELSTDSRTGALGLYEHVGMRVKLSFEHWAKRL